MRDGAALENPVERRQDKERKECRADEAANNNCGDLRRFIAGRLPSTDMAPTEWPQKASSSPQGIRT
jgi:hypothetical protein